MQRYALVTPRSTMQTNNSFAFLGKTTLLNLIMGKLKPLKGSVSINAALRIGHFTQHSADNFDLKLSAVENMLSMFEDSEDQEIRSFLGKFQIQGNDALKPMMLLSGGQKSRVAFAALAYKKPHVLVSKFRFCRYRDCH
jgi:ATP-binding cassette, subfamily F, member 3